MLQKLLLTTLPLALPAGYLLYLHHTLSRKVPLTTTPHLQPNTAAFLPEEVTAQPDSYVVTHETAHLEIPTSSLPPITRSPDEWLLPHTRSCMTFFARTPQAWGISYLLRNSEARATFSRLYLQRCKFDLGEVACGVYRVVSRGPGFIEMALEAPEGYKGPVVEGRIVSRVEVEGEKAVFWNETVMWRRVGEPRTLLEGAVGRWLHGLMVRWMLDSGTRGLMEGTKKDA
ncbi:hypothetical protein EJ06DRAFT_534121 [Trichodelitschia bisporula]|uniref:Uncharacterized protein n=1 Tax=Trichodelitschia bisporula TaxID=703511 RepID=A0A6G1HKM9_9PEZI|nr:hypothetical protein EJ06DRAFT_534121 [Trichodelitschia bisporula]